MTISWNESFAIDHGMIDDDHRFLIDLSNKFIRLQQSASKQELAKVLRDLEHYARSHFWRESQLQQKINYPYCQDQETQHKQLVDSLATIAIKFHHAVGEEDIRAVAGDISKLLRSWLVDHILQSDIYMAAFRTQIKAVSQDIASMTNGTHQHRTIGSDVLHQLVIDHGLIDSDHQNLAELINNFIIGSSQQADDAYLAETLQSLYLYAQTHFVREEDLQRQAGFPDAESHAQIHRGLVKRLTAFQTMLKQHQDPATIRDQMCDMLKSWLLDHVADQDARMQPYVAKMK